MKTLVKLNKTLLFIVLYVVFSNIGIILSEYFNISYIGEIILLLALTLYIVFSCLRNKLTLTIGLCPINNRADVKYCLYYLPLLILVLLNGVFYTNEAMESAIIIKIIVYMGFVAFLEEVIFRGMLIKAIAIDDKYIKKAVIISSLTFGFGHIVNLLNGYTSMEQIMQIVLAVVIGGILSMLFIRTKSIVPGIIFHFLFNLASALSLEVSLNKQYTLFTAMVIISSAYLFYLCKTNRSK